MGKNKYFQQNLFYSTFLLFFFGLRDVLRSSGFVTDPIDYKYSSARNYGNDDQTILEIDRN